MSRYTISLRISTATLLLCLTGLSALAADAIPPIPRVLPPEGLEIPAEVRSRLETRLAATKKRLESLWNCDEKPDIEVFVKAVDLALTHREFYVEKDFVKADWALDEANKRLDLFANGESPWTKTTGLVVQGHRSSIDESAQPYGLVIPKDHDFTKPCPLYVWLHGRGDKNTDIHFLQERATKPGQITPPGAIVVHPFGRHCVGWKHAGEIDVLEAVASVKRRYKIDADRVVLIGFSMGGAGAWHLGAHYPDQWVAVSPGAGFVDVAKYQKLTPANSGEWYVQKLWGLYDVPDYVRNLFNTNVIAYSGELDKQREAAVIMEEAYKSEGRVLTHLIGPGVEHKYEPNTLVELMKRLDTVVREGRKPFPNEIHLQTKSLAHGAHTWIAIGGLEEHWKDSRIDAKRTQTKIEVSTKNVAHFWINAPAGWRDLQVVIDGQDLGLLTPKNRRVSIDRGSSPDFGKVNGQWRRIDPRIPPFTSYREVRKAGHIQGPIDDAFVHGFKVITPSGKSHNKRFQAWCDSELNHFKERWKALMRAELPVVEDRNFNADKSSPFNLILWGDPDSNLVIAKLMAEGKLPVGFTNGEWSVGDSEYDGDKFVPQLIYPRIEGMGRYLVLNSGLTFREAHDRTNSQQNPKLPDWAIIDITQPPDANTPGRIHDADFFDENWQLKRQPKVP